MQWNTVTWKLEGGDVAGILMSRGTSEEVYQQTDLSTLKKSRKWLVKDIKTDEDLDSSPFCVLFVISKRVQESSAREDQSLFPRGKSRTIQQWWRNSGNGVYGDILTDSRLPPFFLSFFFLLKTIRDWKFSDWRTKNLGHSPLKWISRSQGWTVQNLTVT